MQLIQQGLKRDPQLVMVRMEEGEDEEQEEEDDTGEESGRRYKMCE